MADEDVARVLGVSSNTLQRRRKEREDTSMPAAKASKAWLLAETMAKAEVVFGGTREAAAWMATPAIGLNNSRPIELLQTLQGAELVSDLLTRLEYGVYS